MTKKAENGITFLAPEEAPPPRAGRLSYTRWESVREALTANPNVWAIVLEAQEGEPGYNSVHGKKTALSHNHPDIEAEVRTEGGIRRLYARALV